MAPSETALDYDAIATQAQAPDAVAASAAAAHTYLEVFWPAEGVSALHLTMAIGFLERLARGESFLGASLYDLALVREAIDTGVLKDQVPIDERKIVSDVLAQAMGYMRRSGAN